MNNTELKEFLDSKYLQYNQQNFIENDPILIPHSFSKKEDIEISGFLTATIAWGKRQMIINNANKLMDMMDWQPYDFVLNASKRELKQADTFIHRTFNGSDLLFFIASLKNIYANYGGLESVFCSQSTAFDSINYFRKVFLETPHLPRSEKHVSSPLKGSSAKRLNMYLRWMVRKDNIGVDFGIWNKFSMSELMIPLDVHTGNIARKLELISRKQNDWKALEELMQALRKLDPKDPCKYDYALFGLGVSGEF